MARTCDITNRKAQTGNKRSHAMNASSRKFELNLQKVTFVDSKGKKHIIEGSNKGIRTEKKKIEASYLK